MKKIYIGTDHAGFELKEKLKKWLTELHYEVEDMGASEYKKDDDYNDFILPVAEAVASEVESIGIILGGSGVGETILANRMNGIRCVNYYGGWFKIPKLAREHNDANIISIGARFVSFGKAKRAIKIFLDTKFSGDERHKRRINRIDQ